MPTAPLKLCAHPGCGRRTSGRHCGPHARAAAVAREARRAPRIIDGESTSGGGRKAFWRQLRAEVLARDPMCRDCGRAPSKHADHVIAKRDGGADHVSNLRGVCHSCHSAKTARVDGGFGNPRRQTGTQGRAEGKGVENPQGPVGASARPPFFTRPQVSPTRFSAPAAAGGLD